MSTSGSHESARTSNRSFSRKHSQGDGQRRQVTCESPNEVTFVGRLGAVTRVRAERLISEGRQALIFSGDVEEKQPDLSLSSRRAADLVCSCGHDERRHAVVRCPLCEHAAPAGAATNARPVPNTPSGIVASNDHAGRPGRRDARVGSDLLPTGGGDRAGGCLQGRIRGRHLTRGNGPGHGGSMAHEPQGSALPHSSPGRTCVKPVSTIRGGRRARPVSASAYFVFLGAFMGA